MAINILILAAGKADSDSEVREFPICLAEINGRSLLECVVQSALFAEDSKFYFAFNARLIGRFHLDKIATFLAPESKVFNISETKGSACTALLAACQMDLKNELLIISANELVNVNLLDVISNFRSRQLDGGTIVFKSLHPRYSYVLLDQANIVIEASQRDPISNIATTGIFWYSKTSDFIESAENSIRKDANVDGAFFIAPVFNEMILVQKRIGVYEINSSEYRPIKNDKQLDQLI
jgi:hypothetical protein